VVVIQGIKRFIGIGGYKKGYLVKVGFLFEICIGRGFNKMILGSIYQYLVKLEVFINIS
jgi:hypothetical protein